MKGLYWILHFFVGCKDSNLDYAFRGRKGVCQKCGRVYFMWNN